MLFKWQLIVLFQKMSIPFHEPIWILYGTPNFSCLSCIATLQVLSFISNVTALEIACDSGKQKLCRLNRPLAFTDN